MSRSTILFAVIALAVILGGGFLLLSRRPSNPTPLTLPNSTAMDVSPTPPSDTDTMEPKDSMDSMTTNEQPSNAITQEIQVTAKQWEFIPNTITVNQGDHVKLLVTSADVTHGLAIPEYNINQTIEPGQTTTIEFDATIPGTFSFFCSVPCGTGHSHMTGQLVVNPSTNP